MVVSREQMASDIGGETVILGLTVGRYYGLDAVGARIWQLIQSPAVVSDVTRTLVAEYDVDAARCESDVLRLLDSMAAAGLVEVQSDAPA
ncbi:MAG TPA: PqqD family peptide modification chaperone [Thermoanaerobaculia bacterium]